MLSWIQKTFRGYLGVGHDSDMGNRMSWSPWSVRKEHLWSPRKAACDAVTCSECPAVTGAATTQHRHIRQAHQGTLRTMMTGILPVVCDRGWCRLID